MIYAIALGAAVGGVLRFWFEQFSLRFVKTSFPLGTLAANLLGSFVLGWLTASTLAGTDGFLITASLAFTGAFTTFGGFIGQGVLMMKAGLGLRGMLYLSGTVVGSIAAAWFGLQL